MGEKRSILILCGGTGPRLWPMSRASKPKQFLKIFNGESFLRKTVLRAIKIVNKENVFLISNEKYIEQIAEDVKGLVPRENVMGEPQKKNTMIAIMYGVSRIGGGTVLTLPSDHFIENEDKFRVRVLKAMDEAEKLNSIVTIGIKPSWNNPAFGYILTENNKNKTYAKVNEFVEKPDSKKAEVLVKSGAWWNSGMYVFKSEILEKELAVCSKEYFNLWQKLLERNEKNTKKIFELSPPLAIDKVISERSKNMVMIGGDFGWSDVGEWGSIYKKLAAKKNQNVVIGKNTNFVEVKSSGCLVEGDSKRLIGLVGVSNLAVIEVEDALLICNLDDSYEVRNLITKIVADKKLAKYFLESYEERK